MTNTGNFRARFDLFQMNVGRFRREREESKKRRETILCNKSVSEMFNTCIVIDIDILISCIR